MLRILTKVAKKKISRREHLESQKTSKQAIREQGNRLACPQPKVCRHTSHLCPFQWAKPATGELAVWWRTETRNEARGSLSAAEKGGVGHECTEQNKMNAQADQEMLHDAPRVTLAFVTERSSLNLCLLAPLCCRSSYPGQSHTLGISLHNGFDNYSSGPFHVLAVFVRRPPPQISSTAPIWDHSQK